jgi:hypothetical protein
LSHLWIVFRKISENDLAPAFCQLNDFLGKIEDRYFILPPKVYRGVLLRIEEAVDSLDKIGDVAETSGLLAVTKHGDIFRPEGLNKKGGECSPIIESHPGAIGVENSGNPGVDFMSTMVSHCESLGKALRLVIHSSGADGINIAEIVLWLWMNERVTIDLGCGRQEEPCAFLFGQPKGFVSSQGSHLQGLYGKLEVVDGTGRRGEVKNILQGALDIDVLCHVVVDKCESLIAKKVRNVICTSSKKIVHADHFMTPVDKEIAEVGA